MSVIVPTEGRVRLVGRLLESLVVARQAVVGGTEVLIVDSSQGDDAHQIARLCERFDASYVEGPRSVRAKRNLGARMARGGFLHFVDSDCWVRPDTITALLSVAEIERAGGAVGVTEMAGPGSFSTRVAEASPFLDAFGFAAVMEEVPWATMTNCMVKKAAFDAVGGFDEDLPFRLGGDDLDLTWRLNLDGYLLLASPDSTTYHGRETWSSFRSLLRRSWRWGSVEAHLRVKHPTYVRRVAPSLPALIGAAVTGLALAAVSAPGLLRPLAVVALVLTFGFVQGEVRGQIERSSGSVLVLPVVWLLLGVYWAGRWKEGVHTRSRPFTRLFYDSPYLTESHLVFDVPAQASAVWWLLLSLLLAMVIG